MQQAAAQSLVTYDDQSYCLTFKATDETLATYNADLTKPVGSSSSNGCWSSIGRWGSYLEITSLCVNDAYEY